MGIYKRHDLGQQGEPVAQLSEIMVTANFRPIERFRTRFFKKISVLIFLLNLIFYKMIVNKWQLVTKRKK